ncbi:hypothetical protein BDK51DRAFT_40519 [Blyttiomyces helicus]|uniref:Uncharacterized protein n=1 Tax=Blyttiomyces helicus TaxID=388810 RepID=A0A4P9WL53_9FUNG|nr:hypothetical protein BDK51DRAFT_40519 [Blyttiomyces helicus]|eukprot:RKO92783.1 hypothetical protein BDK51DRAFT_40519 [Blyttiomyces helicus]
MPFIRVCVLLGDGSFSPMPHLESVAGVAGWGNDAEERTSAARLRYVSNFRRRAAAHFLADLDDLTPVTTNAFAPTRTPSAMSGPASGSQPVLYVCGALDHEAPTKVPFSKALLFFEAVRTAISNPSPVPVLFAAGNPPLCAPIESLVDLHPFDARVCALLFTGASEAEELRKLGPVASSQAYRANDASAFANWEEHFAPGSHPEESALAEGQEDAGEAKKKKKSKKNNQKKKNQNKKTKKKKTGHTTVGGSDGADESTLERNSETVGGGEEISMEEAGSERDELSSSGPYRGVRVHHRSAPPSAGALPVRHPFGANARICSRDAGSSNLTFLSPIASSVTERPCRGAGRTRSADEEVRFSSSGEPGMLVNVCDVTGAHLSRFSLSIPLISWTRPNVHEALQDLPSSSIERERSPQHHIQVDRAETQYLAETLPASGLPLVRPFAPPAMPLVAVSSSKPEKEELGIGTRPNVHEALQDLPSSFIERERSPDSNAQHHIQVDRAETQYLAETLPASGLPLVRPFAPPAMPLVAVSSSKPEKEELGIGTRPNVHEALQDLPSSFIERERSPDSNAQHPVQMYLAETQYLAETLPASGPPSAPVAVSSSKLDDEDVATETICDPSESEPIEDEPGIWTTIKEKKMLGIRFERVIGAVNKRMDQLEQKMDDMLAMQKDIYAHLVKLDHDVHGLHRTLSYQGEIIARQPVAEAIHRWGLEIVEAPFPYALKLKTRNDYRECQLFHDLVARLIPAGDARETTGDPRLRMAPIAKVEIDLIAKVMDRTLDYLLESPSSGTTPTTCLKAPPEDEFNGIVVVEVLRSPVFPTSAESWTHDQIVSSPSTKLLAKVLQLLKQVIVANKYYGSPTAVVACAIITPRFDGLPRDELARLRDKILDAGGDGLAPLARLRDMGRFLLLGMGRN